MWLFLEPIDVWLFRDGRPFDAGSDHRAASHFPPYPSVIQGVVRSCLLVIKKVDLCNRQAIAETVGTADNYKGLRIRGPFLARQEGARLVRYFPQPADAFLVNRAEHRLRPASPPQDPGQDDLLTSAPTPCLLGLEDKPEKGEGGLWLDEASLLQYLTGHEVQGIEASELFVRESRFGIARDAAKRTTREGALYEAEFIRPSPGVGLLVEVNGYDGWPDTGILRIGGEGRGARYTRVEVPPWPDPRRAPLPKRFKVYFATPTYFKGGWQPEGGDWRRFFSGQVTLQAAALHKYETVGGYDWAADAHKPSRRYVPAGSVYYFQHDGEAQLTQEAITDFGAEIGFGQILIQEW